MPTPSEQAEQVGRQVADEYRRSGVLPSDFRDWLRQRGVSTDWLTTVQLDRFAREWAQDWLSDLDAGKAA